MCRASVISMRVLVSWQSVCKHDLVVMWWRFSLFGVESFRQAESYFVLVFMAESFNIHV